MVSRFTGAGTWASCAGGQRGRAAGKTFNVSEAQTYLFRTAFNLEAVLKFLVIPKRERARATATRGFETASYNYPVFDKRIFIMSINGIDEYQYATCTIRTARAVFWSVRTWMWHR